MSGKAERSAPYSLRRRLTIAMIAGFLLVLSVIAIGFWNYATRAADRTYDLLLDGSAIAIRERIFQGADGEIDVDFPPSALEILGLAENDRVFYRIFDSEGRTITGSDDLPVAADMPTAGGNRFFDTEYGGEEVRFVVHGGTVSGPTGARQVNVQVGQTRAGRDDMKNDLFVTGMLVLSAIAAIGIIFLRFSVNLAMRPLAGIVADIERRDPGNLSPLIAEPPREVAGLIVAINGFMRRLGTSQDNAQNFIADVAHQIRTSLSALRGQIEIAGEQQDSGKLRDRVGKAAEQAARTIHLTNQLLSHAMVIHRADIGAGQPVDLVRIVTGLIEEAVNANGTEAEFGFSIDPRIQEAAVMGDPVSLREAIRNLIDNAIRYSPGEPGQDPVISLGLELHSGDGAESVVLFVEDNGPGIPEEARDRVFERFYSANKSSGSGLGLTIAKAVAESHGGSIGLTQARTGGLRVEIRLPARKNEVR